MSLSSTAILTTCAADHRPYGHGEQVPTRVVRDVLDSHGVSTRLASDGSVLAWEEATARVDAHLVDASDWIVAPTTACDLAAWLGY